MEVKIIDEKAGNPFKYFDKKPFRNFSRDYRGSENVPEVMNGLLEQLGLQREIHCLEIGAGANHGPSRSLSYLGAKVTTLDADWRPERHTDISHERLNELQKELGKELVIPRVGGKNGEVTGYMGDVAFLRDSKSPLKDKEFDLLYFWGSMDATGICSSVENSDAPKEYGVKIKYSDRLLTPIPAVKKGGKIISVAQYFNGHQDEEIYNVGNNNMDLTDLGLFWALTGGRDAKVLGFFIQSPQSVIERKEIELDDKTEAILCENPLYRVVKTSYFSRFGKEQDYIRLKEAMDRLGTPNKQRLENLGMIDAVFVGY
jgi:hypothetical protein